jgi:hypothetical protein
MIQIPNLIEIHSFETKLLAEGRKMAEHGESHKGCPKLKAA